jgi:hypothetical protein
MLLKRYAVHNDLHVIPAKKWFKSCETGDMRHLLKDKFNWCVPFNLGDFWHEINNQYIKEFGLSPEIQKRITLSLKISNLSIKYMKLRVKDVIKARRLLNQINIAEADMKALKKDDNKTQSPESLMPYFIQFYNTHLKYDNMTAYEFFTNLNYIQKSNITK